MQKSAKRIPSTSKLIIGLTLFYFVCLSAR
jgi:hypothetical protein